MQFSTRAVSGTSVVVLLILSALSLLVGCTPAPTPIPAPSATPTPPPTLVFPTRSAVALCGDLDQNWARGDWQAVIAALDSLAAVGGACGGADPALKLYPAWYNYGAALEKAGHTDDAVQAYRTALLYDPQGVEAARALQQRAALTPIPREQCGQPTVQTKQAGIAPYQPIMSSGFVRLTDAQFTIDATPFRARGVNYYPAAAPWRRFLTESQPDAIARELDMIAAAGFNSIRIFLWYDALFDCEGDGPIPNPLAFARLDAVVTLAAQRNLRLIVTLNDLPDLIFYPLYTRPELAAQQTAYIVDRYRDEPAILAWDLRNEGDIDYIRKLADGRAVIDWLKTAAAQVRQRDPNHLITAGWNDDAGSTRNAVDFISFHHWTVPGRLAERIKAIRDVTDKPILLQEVGYSGWGQSDAAQADQLRATLTAANDEKLLGWLVWTAFDYSPAATCIPPACPGRENAEHHFGLWRRDYSPKPALDAARDAE